MTDSVDKVARKQHERRRLKMIPNAFGEKAVLKLMFGAKIRAAERWRNIKITEFERRQMHAVRQDLDQLYEAENGLAKPASKETPQAKLSSKSRTLPPYEGLLCLLVLLPPLFFGSDELLFCNIAVAIFVHAGEAGFGSSIKLLQRDDAIAVGVNISEALSPARFRLGPGDNTIFVGIKPVEPAFCFDFMGEGRRRAHKEQRGGEDKAAFHVTSP